MGRLLAWYLHTADAADRDQKTDAPGRAFDASGGAGRSAYEEADFHQLEEDRFAAETGNFQQEARRKLAEKNLDLIVVNEVGRPGTGFASDTNRAALLAREGEDTTMREWTKPELARAICDRLASSRSGRRLS